MNALEALKTALLHTEKWLKNAGMNQVTSQYETELDDEIDAVYNGDEDQQEFEDNVKKILAALALLMFLAATGKTEDDLDEEDQAAIDEFVSEQAQYVGGLAEAVAAAAALPGSGASAEAIAAAQAAIAQRVGYWVNSMAVFGAVTAGVTGATGNRLGQWRLGGTKEHCDTCSSLADGEPHKISWFIDNGYIPREADSSTLQCHGWNCDCGVFDVITGEQLL